jgi:hypothetical protein
MLGDWVRVGAMPLLAGLAALTLLAAMIFACANLSDEEAGQLKTIRASGPWVLSVAAAAVILLLISAAAHHSAANAKGSGDARSTSGNGLRIQRRPPADPVINALRGHLAEFGFVVRHGVGQVPKLTELVADSATDLPAQARSVLALPVESLEALQAKISVLDRQIAARAKADANGC